MLQDNSKIRLVIDINIWISYLIGKGIKKRMDDILSDPRFEICISLTLIEEFVKVTSYPKLRKYISPELSRNFALAMQDDFIIVDILSMSTICSDPKDNYLLSLADDSKANFLVTGDKPHLLILKSYKKTTIIKFSDFCKAFSI